MEHITPKAATKLVDILAPPIIRSFVALVHLSMGND